MAYRAGTEELLSRLAENLDRIVDPALRQRLMSGYLTLLQQWHSGRRGADYDQEVRGLWNQVSKGGAQYKLWPGLGTVHGQFYDARDSALAVLEHLSALTGRQKDLTIRRRWLAELADFRAMVTMLDREAQMASTNVALSRLDNLAASAANLTAQKLIPRLHTWSQAVKAPVPVLDPGGESGSVSIAARPDLWHGAGLGEDSYDWFTEAGQGDFGGNTAEALVAARKKYAEFLGLIERLKKAQVLQKSAEAALGKFAKALNFDRLQADVNENRRQLDSVVASVKGLASDLARTPVTPWDAPGQDAAGLGSGELTPDQGAAMLLYAAELPGLTQGVTDVEKRIAAVNASMGVKSAVGPAIGAGAALFGLGVAAVLLMRKG